MIQRGRTLEIHTSPHISSGASVDVIMRNVVWALLPVAAFAAGSQGSLPALLAAFQAATEGSASMARTSLVKPGMLVTAAEVRPSMTPMPIQFANL